MAGHPPDDEAVEASREGSEPRMPRWVKAGIVALIVVVLVIVLLALTGVHQPPANGHGP